MPNNLRSRRAIAKVSILGTTQMHLRDPWIVALWSAIFPGMGHLLLSKYISGFILLIWEIFINLESNLNLAIFYSFIGKADIAKEVLDIRWLLLYIPTYIFAIWDSYRTTVDLNNHFEVAAREDSEISPFIVSPLGFNYLDKSSPLLAVAWSLMAPGIGQLSIHRIMVAFFIIPWWIVIVYFSKLLPALHHTAFFHFEDIKNIVDKQWLLDVPSFLFFPMYDAYVNTVESNNLYEWELAKYLKKEHQNPRFPIPLGRGHQMYMVSNFEYSINLEKAIAKLQMIGIQKEDILAIPLDKRNEQSALFDSIHYSDKYPTLDFAFLLAALLALFGIIYGFLLPLGPIIWALIGTGVGFGAGVLLRLIIAKKQKRKTTKKAAEIILIISCCDTQLEQIRAILWDNGALGTSKLNLCM